VKTGRIQWAPDFGPLLRPRRCQHCFAPGFWAASDMRGQPICSTCLKALYVEPLQAAATGEDAEEGA